jgi:hypothetical protein
VILRALLLAGFVLVQQPVSVERVSWLQGCWELSSGQRTVEEQWMAPRGGVMIGMGRTVRGGALVEYESVVIRQQGDRLAYEAHPSGEPSAVFLSSTLNESTVVFENPQHDFPQKVGYQRSGAGSLLAWVEGTEKGQTRRIEFPYKRVACPGQ